MTFWALIIAPGDWLFLAYVLLVAVAAIAWLIFRAQKRSPDDQILTDGAVLLISDGKITRSSPEARRLFGECDGRTVISVLQDFLGPAADKVIDAVKSLELTGEAINLLAYTPSGGAYEVIGAPSGALIRLVLRDANYMDIRLRAAEERVSAADSVLKKHRWEQETLRGLVASAPIIAWNRNEDGTLNWTAGQIHTRNGGVSAEQAVGLIVARTKLNRHPVAPDQPQKSRIEIVINGASETVSLHVDEVLQPDGTRIGFATDAGIAASAERTLTRFVQTMTETFAHLTVGLAIFDRNQTLALFNPALVQMWQVEPAWLARRPSLREIIDELRSTRRLPELQDYHTWRTRLLTLFDNTETADYEELWHLADGSNIRVLARPHPHGSLAFIFDDVTERMRLEQRYRHSIDLRRATLDKLAEGIAVFGPNGLLQFVNRAFHEIWNTNSETVYAAMHARQLVSTCEQLTVETETWQRLYAYITGEESRHEWTTRATMRSGRVLTARFSPLPDGSTMAVFADMTDSERIAMVLQERNEALELAEEMRVSLLSQVSDNLRTPVEEIQKLAADLSAVEYDTQIETGFSEGILEASAKLVGAISGLSDLNALPIQPFGLGSSECDLEECLSLAQAILNRQAQSTGSTISVTDIDGPRVVNGDTFRIRQLLCSLGAEALARSAPDSTIELSARVDAEAYRLTARSTTSVIRLTTVDQSISPSMLQARDLARRMRGTVEVHEDRENGLYEVICEISNTPPDREAEAADTAGDSDVAEDPDDVPPALEPPAKLSGIASRASH
ncbi:MAG: PAS-domain containing protein [Pseudomonadota bacterium]